MMKKETNFNKAKKYIIVFAVAVIIVVIVRFFASRKQVAYVPPTAAVSVMYPTMGNISEELVLNAHIEARAMVPVIPMVSGTILAYPAKAGDIVAKGDLLAEIDKAPFEQQMLQAKAAYKGYESSFTRVEGLYRSGAATRQEYDTLMAQRDAAKAQYDLAELQLSYANVTAPVNGTVIAAPMAVGSVAGAPNPIAIVADLDDLVVKLNVPEKYYPIFVKNRDSLEAFVVRPDYDGIGEDIGAVNRCEAEIDTIAPYIDGASKTFEAIFKLKNVPVDFKPGMFVELNVIFNKYENVPLIPRGAKLSDGTLYTLKKNDLLNSENDKEQGKSKNKKKSGKNKADAGLSSDNDIFEGSVECIVLDKYVADDKWLMVPKDFADTMFIVRGQNNVLSGQSVSATYEKLSDDKGAM